MAIFTKPGLSHHTTLGGTGICIDQTDQGSLLIGDGVGFKLSTLTAGSGISITNGDGTITISGTAAYSLPIASNSVLGGIKVGTGLSIDGGGVLSALIPVINDATTTVPGVVLIDRNPSSGDPIALSLYGLTATPLGPGYGGTGLDSSTASNGQLLIGTGTGFSLATITAGASIGITNTAGHIQIDFIGGGVGTGTVTSVDLSMPGEFSVSGNPITSAGTLTVTKANQTVNKVYAAPSGGTGAPTFRLLVATDIPSLDAAKITTGTFTTSQIPNLDASKITTGVFDPALLPVATGSTLGAIKVGTTLTISSGVLDYNLPTASASVLGGIKVGSGLSISSGVLSSTGSGSVTSVALTAPSEISVAGSPVTTAGTIALTWASESFNSVFAAPDGSNGTPSFRRLVLGDLPFIPTYWITGSFGSGSLPADVVYNDIANTFNTGPQIINSTRIASNAYGMLSVGDAPWDGTSIFHFVGDNNGTVLAVNSISSSGNIIDFQTGGTSRFKITGGARFTTSVFDWTFLYTANSSNIFNFLPDVIGVPGMTASSGTQCLFNINPKIIQTGTASYVGVLVNVTETTTGSGTKQLINLQVGGVSKFSVDNQGNITAAGVINSGSLPIATTSTVGAVKAGAGLLVQSDGTLSVSRVNAYQIVSVAPSVIAPGIVAAQISSVNPSTLTGSGTVPRLGIPIATASLLGGVIAGSGINVDGSGVISTVNNGTVTSVAVTVPSDMSVSGSPVISSGTLGITRNAQTGNVVMASPSGGGSGTPGFRSLVGNDIPNLDASKITTGIFSIALLPVAASSTVGVVKPGRSLLVASDGTLRVSSVDSDQVNSVAPSVIAPGIVAGQITSVNPSSLTGSGTVPSAGLPIATGADLGAIKVGTGLSIASGVLSTVNNGTVTSVAMTVPADFGISGSAITTSGTLGLTWNAQTGNVVMASPSGGGSGTPTFRSLVAADIPSLDASKTTTGTFAAARLGNAKSKINFFINTFGIRGGSLGVSPAGDGVLLGSFPVTAVGSCKKALTGGTVFTDLTSAANNATTSDVTFNFAAVNDAFYISHATLKYTAVKIKYTTASAYSATLVWEYWNGSAWSTLLTTTPTFLVDATAGTFPATNPLKATAGTLFLTFNPPSDWASTTVNTVAGFYVRLRVSAFTSLTTGIAADQIWLYTVTSGVGLSAGQSGNITRIEWNVATTLSGATTDSKFIILNGTTGSSYLFTATKGTQNVVDTTINLAVAETDQILVQQVQQNAAAIAPSSEFAGVNFSLLITPS